MCGPRSNGEPLADGGQPDVSGNAVYSPEGGSAAHVRLDAEGRVASWNRVAADVLGYDAADVVGRPLEDLLADSVGEAWVDDALNRATRHGQIVEETPYVDPAGRQIEIEITLAVERDADGDPVGYLCAMRPLEGDPALEEMTARRGKWLRTLFERSPDSIGVHDADGDVLQISDQNVEDLGYTREELLSMNVADFEADQDLEELQEIWTDMETGSRETIETRLRRKDGSTYPAEVSVTKLDVGGEPLFLAHGRDITERHERERELELYETFVENADDMITVIDPNGTIEYVSPSIERILGYEPSSFVGEDGFSFVHPTDRESVRSDIRQIVENGSTGGPLEFRFRDSEGEYHWIESTVWNLLEDSAVEGLLMSNRDITVRKQYERQLAEERDYLHSIVESLPYPFYVVDVDDYTVDHVNARANVQPGETCYEITHRRDRPCDEGPDAVDCPIREVMTTGEPATVEHVHHDESGDERVYEVHAAPIEGESGEVEMIAESAIDVTERHERERQLEELSERYEFAINGANLAVWDWDLRTDGVKFNDNWATMLGLDPEEIGSRFEEWEQRVHPDDVEPVMAALERHIAGETAYYETEHRMKTASGDWKWIQDIGKVFERDDNGEPLRAVGIHIDIDDRKRAERTLREERDMFADGPVVVLKRRLESGWPIEYVSPNVESVFGYDAATLLGEGAYADVVHPQDREVVESAIEGGSSEDSPFDVGPYRIHDGDGDVRWVRETTKIIREETGPDRYLGYLVDVTERVEREQLLERQRTTLQRIRNVTEGIRPLNRALARASTREEIITLVCEKLTATDMYRFAWFGEYDPLAERVTPEAWAGAEEGYLDEVELAVEAPDTVRGPVDRAIRSKAVHTSRNIATDPAFEPWRDPALERGFNSTAAIPIVIEGNVHGVLSVYSNRPNAFDPYERELLGELGERVGHAIQAAERRQLLQGEAAKELVFRIEDERSPFVDVSKQLNCRLELQSIVPAAGNSYIGYMSVDGAPPEDVVDFFEGSDAVERARVISADDDAGRFEYVVSTSPGTKLLEYEVSITDAFVEDGEEIIHGEVAPETSMKPIVAGLQWAFDDVELVAKRSVDRSARIPRGLRESIADALTTRQREVLSLAFQAGYFESPRRSTGEELAETVGIASPTFYVHVRRGTRNVLEQLDEFEILK